MHMKHHSPEGEMATWIPEENQGRTRRQHEDSSKTAAGAVIALVALLVVAGFLAAVGQL